MRIIKIYLVCILGLYGLLGCGGPSNEKEISVKGVSTKPQQSVVETKTPSIATVATITREAVPEKPGVTRVIMLLDKQAQYSTSREGNSLIVNVFNAKMKSSIKQLEVQDPVIKSITAKQVGNSVKGIIELVHQDVAYTPSTSTNPFQIFVDIWQISSKTALNQPSGEKEKAIVPKPVQSIEVSPSRSQSADTSASQRTQEISLDVRKAPEEKITSEAAVEVTPGSSTALAPSTQEVPAQLQWFSEKLSQELQEKEKLRQDLLEIEKSVAAKDSMIQLLEKKVKEANTRVVELEEELIKAKTKTSLAEQNDQDTRDEIHRVFTQMEEALGEQVTTGMSPSQREQIQDRSEKILGKISESKGEMESLKTQVASLTEERDGLRSQVESCSTEMATLRDSTAKLAAIEREMRVKELELAKLRQAIGAAAQLVMGKSGEVAEGTPTIEGPQSMSPGPLPVTPEVQAGKPKPTEESSEMIQSLEVSPAQQKQPLVLADLIRQQQLSDQTASPEDYVLGPEDVIQIKVLKEENLDKTVTVSSDGFITYPLLGDLRVEGLTTAQVDAQITSLLARDFLVDPEVTVDVVKSRSKKVYIMGAVKQPGYQELSRDQKLLGTLLNAGGPTSFETEVRVLRLPKGDLSSSDIMETPSPIVVDLNKLFVEGDQTQNIVLHDGDVLMVAAKTSSSSATANMSLGPQQFYVVGSVVNPGVYTYKPNDTVLDAILRAGGFTEFASRNSVKLVREADGKTRTFRLKMKDVMEKGEMDKNMGIIPGDMLIVPESFF
jgi:polysaccharide export outer membrane protein